MSQIECNTVVSKWRQVLSDLTRQAEQIAQSSQRTRKLSVEQLVQVLVLGSLNAEQVSLRLWSEIASEIGCEITASSLDERLTKRAVVLLYEVLQLSIRQALKVKPLPVKQLGKLSRLVLYDSTSVSVAPILRDTFRAASAASGLGHMKLQVGYDYLNAQLCSLTVHEGIDPDQKDEGLLQQAVQDALLVFDLGYFSQHLFGKIEARGASYVTRFLSQVGLYDVQTEGKIELVDQLKNRECAYFEGLYKLGYEAKVTVRLIARKRNQQQAEKRRRDLKIKAARNGYNPSQSSLILCDWDILITNLPHSWSGQQVLDLYRLRWQIELLFKAWKSYLDLTQFGYWRAERVLCQIYATLIAAVLCQVAFASVRYLQSETSLFKAFRIIQRHVTRLLPLIRRHWRGSKIWEEDLKRALRKFGQQQNLEKTPSSLRRLINWGLT